MITVLDSHNFESEITNSCSPVIVDFFASWCGPCKMLSPVLENIDEKFGENLKILKVDIDKFPELANKYNIMSVPTLIFFENGEIVRQETGFMLEEKIMEFIKSDFYINTRK